ncbi:hypothetical protein C8F01DRAFT_1361388 [Mycena amicta]|nr:hypothetical protein C8F01DRAFT_1361388 [Mycena amicta]
MGYLASYYRFGLPTFLIITIALYLLFTGSGQLSMTIEAFVYGLALSPWRFCKFTVSRIRKAKLQKDVLWVPVGAY